MHDVQEIDRFFGQTVRFDFGVACGNDNRENEKQVP